MIDPNFLVPSRGEPNYEVGANNHNYALPQRARFDMSAESEYRRNGNSANATPDPYSPSHYMHGHVGSIATWKCSTENYPDFELDFGDSNPFNDEEIGTFRGTDKQPITLVLNKAGIYQYTIKHMNPGGAEVLLGPYCINVAPPPMFLIPPRKCPPECGSVPV